MAAVVKIRLSELLQYLTSPSEKIQIVMQHADWDKYDEFRANSPLLNPLKDFLVTDLGAIEDDVIRVAISDPSYEAVDINKFNIRK